MQDDLKAGSFAITLRSIICAALAGAPLAACAMSSPLTVFADPAKYEYLNCEQLAGQRKYWSGREEELRLLMAKAEQGVGGTLASMLAYKTDHVTAVEELKVIEHSAHAKNCAATEH